MARFPWSTRLHCTGASQESIRNIPPLPRIGPGWLFTTTQTDWEWKRTSRWSPAVHYSYMIRPQWYQQIARWYITESRPPTYKCASFGVWRWEAWNQGHIQLQQVGRFHLHWCLPHPHLRRWLQQGHYVHPGLADAPDPLKKICPDRHLSFPTWVSLPFQQIESANGRHLECTNVNLEYPLGPAADWDSALQISS